MDDVKITEIAVDQCATFLRFLDKTRGVLFSIERDGSITLGPACTTTDEAAREFWRVLERWNPLRARVIELEAELAKRGTR